MQPGYQYFERKFGTDLKVVVSAFKCARYFDPSKINELKPCSSDIYNLRVLPFMDSDDIIDELKHELPTYMAIVDGTSADANKLEWWKNHASKVPKWSRGCRAILLLQPSSAAADRVFSLLTNSFKEQQTQALEDYIETSVMLQYNKRH